MIIYLGHIRLYYVIRKLKHIPIDRYLRYWINCDEIIHRKDFEFV